MGTISKCKQQKSKLGIVLGLTTYTWTKGQSHFEFSIVILHFDICIFHYLGPSWNQGRCFPQKDRSDVMSYVKCFLHEEIFFEKSFFFAMSYVSGSQEFSLS